MAFKMKGKSPMMKALIGKQKNLPDHLKQKILDAPESPMKLDDPRDGMEPPTARARRVKKRLLNKKGGGIAAVTRRINEGNIKGAKLQSRGSRAKDMDRKRKLDRKTDVADQKFFKDQVERRREK